MALITNLNWNIKNWDHKIKKKSNLNSIRSNFLKSAVLYSKRKLKLENQSYIKPDCGAKLSLLYHMETNFSPCTSSLRSQPHSNKIISKAQKHVAHKQQDHKAPTFSKLPAWYKKLNKKKFCERRKNFVKREGEYNRSFFFPHQDTLLIWLILYFHYHILCHSTSY